jgi:beta-mannosidase
MKNKILFVPLAIAFLLTGCLRNQPMTPKRVLLHDNWTVQKVGSDTIYEARVPGCVHLDLLDNISIPDPFYGENEKLVQWIENEDWIYQSKFRATTLLLNYSHIDLVFEGLDTYADVYLNDSLLLNADNMFRKWKVDVKDLLRMGHNDLKVVFHSPVRTNREKAAVMSYSLPDERAFSRKAPCMFGWDWGPRLVSSGIWKPVYFEAWEDLKIESWRAVTDSLGEDKAKLRLLLNVLSRDSMELDCMYRISVMDRETLKVKLKPGENRLEIPFVLNDPKLWWTHNLGDPFLYDFTVSFRIDEETLDRQRGKFGIRTIELVHEPDNFGKSFYFKLNGVAVFMKGANYIPQDNFPSRVTRDKYIETISNAVRSNMNMLRVWGGGIYEDDLFYELCDRWGILVWQDFMFACTMYPGDSAFLMTVKEEAKQQVIRLRNHPSLALWCGNNEVDEAWHNWGWQKQFTYSSEDSAEIWEDYLEVFHRLLPEIVEEYDGNTAYWPSSPKHGWGREESLSDGDMHYWGVWWGREPFAMYNKKVGRFMSEYGFQGYPPYKTLIETIPEEELYFGSPSMLNHQKHPFGEEVIREFIGKSYPVPSIEKLEDYVYLSQLTQAYGIQTAIEAHRRNMPRCMGTLYWQLNDCWPAVSWSGLDYHNRWKALHHFVKRSYEDVMISIQKEDEELDIYIISDLLQDTTGQLVVTSMDFSGDVIFLDSSNIYVKANASSNLFSIESSRLLGEKSQGEIFVRILLKNEEDTIASKVIYFTEPKSLELAKPDIIVDITESSENKNDVIIQLETGTLVKDLYLSFKDMDGRFSTNYFDLLPGEKKAVTFYPEGEYPLPGKDELVLKHLYQLVNN